MSESSEAYKIANWRPEMPDGPNFEMNKMHNATNEYQGAYKRVLCCCSAGLLRSPTAAVVLSQAPFNFNTRACGLEDSYALVDFTRPLAFWAQEIVVMTKRHEMTARMLLEEYKLDRPIKVLNIPDNFAYRNEELMRMIKDNYLALEGNNV